MLGSGTILMVLTTMMGIADTLIAGMILGESAVSGICLALPIYSLASFFAVFLSYGVPIIYAGEMGAFRKAEADRSFGVGLTVSIGSGILMFLFVLLWGDAFLRAYHPGTQVYAYASDYLVWMKFAVLLLPLNVLLDGMLFADGDEHISLAANLAQGCVKIILSVVLCRSMGVQGLVLASVISFAVSILISCVHFFRPGNTLRLNLAFSPVILRNIMKYGIVDAGTHLSLSLFTFAMNFFVMRVFGREKLILVSVITLLRESQILFEGIGEAITPLMSMYLGEECYPGVRRVLEACRMERQGGKSFCHSVSACYCACCCQSDRNPGPAYCKLRGAGTAHHVAHPDFLLQTVPGFIVLYPGGQYRAGCVGHMPARTGSRASPGGVGRSAGRYRRDVHGAHGISGTRICAVGSVYWTQV